MYRYNIAVRYMGFLLQKIHIRTKLFVQLCKATRRQKDNIFRHKGETFVWRVSAGLRGTKHWTVCILYGLISSTSLKREL